MNKRYAIFDMDGTLVDSMKFWINLTVEYLQGRGVKDISEEILERVKPMTMRESAALFMQEYDLPGSPDSIIQEMLTIMERHYREDVPAKPGVDRYLAKLTGQGVTLCVASATAAPLMERCLSRLGLAHHFQFLLSCEEVGVGKESPEVYHAAARRLGAEPGDIAVYEDAFYALETAKKAGFYCVGIYDVHQQTKWPKIRGMADELITDWGKAAEAMK